MYEEWWNSRQYIDNPALGLHDVFNAFQAGTVPWSPLFISLEEETAELHDTSIPFAVRFLKRERLIRDQEALARIRKDGSIAGPIDPEDTKDVNEYLERLRQIRIAL